MAFLAAGVVALGSAMSWYWWSGDQQSASEVLVPVTESTTKVITKTTMNKKSTILEPNLIDELKLALTARRERRAPGTC